MTAGEGSVSLEASVLSVANSLMVSIIDRVFTPLFCMLASRTSAMMLGMVWKKKKKMMMMKVMELVVVALSKKGELSNSRWVNCQQ